VEEANDGKQALEKARSLNPDLVILDIMMPEMDGLTVCKELRKTTNVPVIILTARGDDIDKIVGLEVGADDYVTKPFSGAELVARIRAVLRRSADVPATTSSLLAAGDLVLNLDTRTLTQGGEPVDLTVKEFELLRLLLEHSGKVVRREKLIADVWDTNWFGSTKTLDVHVSALRRKLGDDPATPRYIHTARGIGFRFASSDELGP